MRSMSCCLFLSCLAITLFSTGVKCFAQNRTRTTEWSRVSSFEFDWDGHGVSSVIFEIQKGDAPGDFTRVRMRLPKQKEFVLTNKDGWVKYNSNGVNLSKKLRNSNLVHSSYVLAAQAKGGRTLLLLFGYAYASSPGSLDVLEVTHDGQPRVVLHQDESGLEELRDLDGDGLAELIVYPCLSQGWGNGLLTYAPFNVYKLGLSPGDPATLSLPLSKDYNLRNYYGWAGAKCSEDIAVVLHPPKGGRPVIVTAKEAQRMTERPPK